MKTEYEKVARQYANALLLIAESKKCEERLLSDLVLVNQVLKADPDFEVVLKLPSVSSKEKKELLGSVFKGILDETIENLLGLLCEKGRLPVLSSIEEQYRSLLSARKNIASGVLICAEELDNIKLASIKAKLSEKLSKHLDLQVSVDKSLIGGYVLQIGDKIIDGSIKGRLQAVEKQLLSV